MGVWSAWMPDAHRGQKVALHRLGPPAQGWLHPPRGGFSCINNHVLLRSMTDSTPLLSNASRQPCINNQEMPTGQSEAPSCQVTSVSVICGSHTWIRILVCQCHSGSWGNEVLYACLIQQVLFVFAFECRTDWGVRWSSVLLVAVPTQMFRFVFSLPSCFSYISCLFAIEIYMCSRVMIRRLKQQA